MSTGWALFVTVLLLAGNGFFVAAEFALVASKRHRLEQAAADGSRAARAAVSGVRELSLMLAGAQLGITVCSLGLGALAEPAIAHSIEPLLARAGLPPTTSYVLAFLLALALVVFLHMVVGEMAPKSWAITHPERSALLLALPFRGFAWLARPLLAVLNGMANAVLRLARVQPQDELAQAHGPQELGMLIEQSREHGLLAADVHRLLTRMLQLQETSVGQLMSPAQELVTVAASDPAAEVERRCETAGRSRLVVTDDAGRIIGQVHLRDAIRATTAGRTTPARQLMSAPFVLAAGISLTTAVAAMRQHRAQLALVTADGSRPVREGRGDVLGFVAMEDLLEQIIGEFEDETDLPAVRRLSGRADRRGPQS